ncbi:hypothetical protein H310_14571 [Aphanomyces invadans]|uniref:ABC transmembrane type-1 domain-containing protein n=1 Tax=Aphanomyces invadans TaxID=157072 RepID=A0A024TBD8_9STRA|nr:hypothetical protein H310_14571 [Aphanomyces invadans]ETV90677.1 hypothetical protein H310_14571 [Aphanomyces invadans]|eukprot:XP_008880674.1 hypothetical protein H310_14571 [Aphanomyces invadans]
MSRSPVINLIAETTCGLSTIRAFGMTDEFAEKSRRILDHSQSFFMVYRLSSRWMQMRLDWLSTGVVAGMAFVAVGFKQSIGIHLQKLYL